jgi:hypothetical protein
MFNRNAPAVGPGTGGNNIYGNCYDQRGQFAPGGLITINMVYDLVGFTNVEREHLHPHLPNLRVFYGMTASSLETLESTLARASPNQRVIINKYHAQLLHGFMYWAQDQRRVNHDPEQAHVLVLEMLEEANDLAIFCNKMKQNSTTTGASTNPGTFRGNDDFYVWANSMYNHLCTQLGAMGVPLSYAICPNTTAQFDIDDDPMMQSIKTAPLYGTKFIADATTVHSIIVGKVADRAAAWIRTSTRTNNNGRKMALCVLYPNTQSSIFVRRISSTGKIHNIVFRCICKTTHNEDLCHDDRSFSVR